MHLKIGIVGAGISSAVFSRLMTDIADITVFEKSRGTGGRLSRHYAEGFNFDIGCQDIILSASTPEIITQAVKEEVLVPWHPKFSMRQANGIAKSVGLNDITCYCGNGSMNQFAKWAYQDTHIKFQTKIIELIQEDNFWFFISENGERYGPFDIVVLSCPTPQIMTLTPTFNDDLSKVTYDSCMIVSLGISKALTSTTPDVIKSENTLARWMIQSHLKPHSTSKPGITIQSKPLDYSHITQNKKELSRIMVNECIEVFNQAIEVEYKKAHIWRYSKCIRPLNKPLLYENQIGIIGDCIATRANQSNIESCIESAIKLSQHIENLV